MWVDVSKFTVSIFAKCTAIKILKVTADTK